VTLELGKRMVRVADGQRGMVAQNGPQLCILYLDRGEERVALRSETWVPDELKPGPLRDEELYLIALHADRALHAFECNEPLKWWEKPALTDVPYDPGLVQCVRDYLSSRKTRPAA
jgi:hypothetical protein